MEMFLFRPSDYDRLYNCSHIQIDQVPLASRQHKLEAIITIALCAIYYVLYIPCTISIYNRMNNACYILLFYMCIVNCSILWILGFLHGWLSLTGAVFCSHPKLIYVTGCLVSAIWIMESVGEISLVTNRCIAILLPRLERVMFSGRRILLWIGVSLVYGTWWGFYMKPCLFNGLHFTWFFYPYVGYLVDKDGSYNGVLHIIWNMSVAIGVPCCYIMFALLFLVKTHKLGHSKEVSHKQKMMLLQVFITSMLNFAACTVYVYMMYVIPNEVVIHFAQFCWFHIHGFPPVIYLCLNRTIRDDTKRMLRELLAKCNQIHQKKSFFSIQISSKKDNSKEGSLP